MRFDEHTMSKFEIDINDMTCTYFNREPNISNAYKSLLLAKFSLLFGLNLLLCCINSLYWNENLYESVMNCIVDLC